MQTPPKHERTWVDEASQPRMEEDKKRRWRQLRGWFLRTGEWSSQGPRLSQWQPCLKKPKDLHGDHIAGELRRSLSQPLNIGSSRSKRKFSQGFKRTCAGMTAPNPTYVQVAGGWGGGDGNCWRCALQKRTPPLVLLNPWLVMLVKQNIRTGEADLTTSNSKPETKNVLGISFPC